jgi:hypothetical protein
MAQPTEIGDLAVTALEARAHLVTLEAERGLALHSPLAGNEAYMSDLEAEWDFCIRLYTVLAVSEIATLRSEPFGPQTG